MTEITVIVLLAVIAINGMSKKTDLGGLYKAADAYVSVPSEDNARAFTLEFNEVASKSDKLGTNMQADYQAGLSQSLHGEYKGSSRELAVIDVAVSEGHIDLLYAVQGYYEITGEQVLLLHESANSASNLSNQYLASRLFELGQYHSAYERAALASVESSAYKVHLVSFLNLLDCRAAAKSWSLYPAPSTTDVVHPILPVGHIIHDSPATVGSSREVLFNVEQIRMGNFLSVISTCSLADSEEIAHWDWR